MKERMGSRCNLLLLFGVQMGHEWDIGALACFHAIGKLQKPFSPIAAEPNAPKHFLEEMGHSPHYPATAHTLSNTTSPQQPHAPTNLSNRNRNRTYSSLSERFLVLRSRGEPRMTQHYLDNDLNLYITESFLLHHNFNIIPENKHILV